MRLLGMMGSAHDGERSNAAALADRLVRDAGLVWEQVVLPAIGAEPGAADPELANRLEPRERDLRDLRWLSDRWTCLIERQGYWTDEFTRYLEDHKHLTGRQRQVLDGILESVRLRGRAA